MTLCNRWGLFLCAAFLGCGSPGDTDTDTVEATATGSANVVISQIYGGGGNSGAPLSNDYVELFNRGTSSVSIAGWSVQYASASGSSWAKASLSGTLPAGGYYLVQLASGGSAGASLPPADATGSMNISATNGKLALVTNQTLLSCGGSSGACLPNASIRDFVGYGTADQFEGGAAPSFSNTSAGLRGARGCTDTDENAADIAVGAPAPRNSGSAHTACGGGGTPGGDGTPTRRPCTGTFGSAMSATYGRLDGFLVAIVDPNTGSSCRGDDNHVHLQVQVNGGVEDIAVNIASTSGNPNVDFRTLAASLGGGAWSEGWHTGVQLDYATSLGVHSSSFTEETASQLTSLVDNALANANHVSIFTTGFDPTGGHLVHREGSNHDGAIVINPTTSNPTYLLFHFANQSF